MPTKGNYFRGRKHPSLASVKNSLCKVSDVRQKELLLLCYRVFTYKPLFNAELQKVFYKNKFISVIYRLQAKLCIFKSGFFSLFLSETSHPFFSRHDWLVSPFHQLNQSESEICFRRFLYFIFLALTTPHIQRFVAFTIHAVPFI